MGDGVPQYPLAAPIASSAHSLRIALPATHATATTFASEAARQERTGRCFQLCDQRSLLAGFAMVAYTAQYGTSEVTTFI
jgi:hypothetical protein